MYQNSMPYVGGCRTSGGLCDPKRVILLYHTCQTTIYNTIYKLLSVRFDMYKMSCLYYVQTPSLELFSSDNCQQNKITLFTYLLLLVP